MGRRSNCLQQQENDLLDTHYVICKSSFFIFSLRLLFLLRLVGNAQAAQKANALYSLHGTYIRW